MKKLIVFFALFSCILRASEPELSLDESNDPPLDDVTTALELDKKRVDLILNPLVKRVVFSPEEGDVVVKKFARKKATILLVHTSNTFGGGEIHKLELYKQLLNNGYDAYLLVEKDSPLALELNRLSLPHFHTRVRSLPEFKGLSRIALSSAITKMCVRLDPAIIQCCSEDEARSAQYATLGTSRPVIMERHLPDPLKTDLSLKVKAIIAVSEQISNMLTLRARERGEGVIIENIAGFFDEERYLNFVPSANKHQFFKKHFDFTPGEATVICMVANMYRDLEHKSHHLLLKAVQQLISQKKRNVELVLVGNGPSASYLKELAHELGIANNVHFLGFTDLVPEILYHSDMHVLSSSKEAFGLVNVEAALMKKPLIVATQTGSCDIVQHHVTGLRFKNGDEFDLAVKIETLIDNKALARKLAHQAYESVRAKYSNKMKFDRIEKLYTRLTLVS